MDGPTDKSGEFHLIVTKPPPGRAANTENESFASVLLQSPMADKPHLAFVRKNSEIFDTVQAATDSGVMFSPVLEVAIVRSAVAVLGWDQETGMPSRATLHRAAQLAWDRPRESGFMGLRKREV